MTGSFALGRGRDLGDGPVGTPTKCFRWSLIGSWPRWRCTAELARAEPRGPVKAATTFALASVLSTFSAAMAGEPTVLTEAQLDHVTGGPIVIRELHIPPTLGPQRVEIYFDDGHPAQPVEGVRFNAEPGFVLRPPSPALNRR